ncbi:MAG: hypothetical protein K0S46_2261 [Moraxellaceae bacterium]|jgi:hypothetical protein|nr:hypothetical protein [Moraxellaceae bacterium]
MATLQYRQPVWWGGFEFAAGTGRTWNLAGLLLAITRQPQEWHFRLLRTPEQSEDNHEWCLQPGEADTATAELCRFVFRQTTPWLQLLPRLADRSVVVRPLTPLFVPAGQATTFYVTTPIWLAAYAEGVAEPLLDVPVVIPRDTWFGPSPSRGEVCYATQVTGRTELAQLLPRPFRAVTPVQVANHGSTALPIERINIPTPFLPVYGAESGRLWTPALSITRHAGAAQPHIHIETGISTEAGHVTRLTPARRGAEEHGLIRVFDNFFD